MALRDSLIYDRKQLKEFLEYVLPKLQRDEVFIAFLGCRKKYYPEIRTSQEFLARKIIKYDDPEIVTQKLEQLGNAKGYYIDNKPIPGDKMHLYFSLNPKSTLKGFKTFASECMQRIYEIAVNPEQFEIFRKLDTWLYSAIHRAQSRTVYWLLDVDNKNEDTFDKVQEMLNDYIVANIETKGGFHIVVKATKESGKLIFTQMKGKLEDLEVHKHCQVVLPGTYQAGFKVYWWKDEQGN